MIGSQGTQGAQGDQGIQGSQGFQGFQGNQGSQGTQGNQGNQGFQGTQGVQGAQGITGVQGYQGITGDSFFTSTTAGSIFTTGSAAFIGNKTGIDSPFDINPNTSFYVSGALSTLGADQPSILFGGDTFISGAFGVSDYFQMKPVGSLRIPTNQSASYIYTSGSTNDMYFTQYAPGTDFTNTTRLRWLESTLSTGLLHGGILSTSLGGTTFGVLGGEGIIVSMNASTSSAPYPTIKYVQWPTTSNISLLYSASAKITYVGIDNTGQIIQQPTPWGSLDITQWDTAINLGVVLHLSGNVSNGVFNSPQISYGLDQQNDDFIRAFGPLKISGHTIEASGSTLSITKTAGSAYKAGANYTINPNHPSTVIESNPITVSKIYRYYMSGSTPVVNTGVANAGYTVLDPTKYVNGNGTLVNVPNNEFSIQRVFWIPNSPTNAFIVYYGNKSYQTLIDAENGVGTEAFTEAPNTAINGILCAHIVVAQDCTSLTDAAKSSIKQAGLFRLVGGVSSSGQGTIPVKLSQLGDVALSTLANGDLLVYSSATDNWKNTKSIQDLTLAGDLAVNNNAITTTSTTFNVINANATTVNFAGGASTALNVGNVLGTNTLSGQTKFPQGLSGSLTHLSDGTSYLVAGTNITITSGSNGSVTIAAPAASQYFSSTTNGSIYATGSVAIRGSESIDSPIQKGTDVFFYVSGSLSGSDAGNRKSLFGGDVVISGSLSVGRPSSKTLGLGSFSQGYESTVQSNYSHAEGISTTVLGNGSHAEGENTLALGVGSHAEGLFATGSADYSHAQGQNTVASGTYSFAGGIYTIASGSGQTVFGGYNKRNNNTSLFVIGTGTGDADASRRDVVRIERGVSVGFDRLEITGSLAQGNSNNIATGQYSHAEGSSSSASNTGAHAEGVLTTASGQGSHAEGYLTSATNSGAHAEGAFSLASGPYSHAQGTRTTGSFDYAHAEGEGSLASGYASHAEGYYTIGSNDYSHAEGNGSTASGQYSHAEGNGSIASGVASHTEGYQTTASGIYSHAEGNGSTASGQYSHAEGYQTTASGNRSHAEGQTTTASNQGAHAEGLSTTASGQYSHAEGSGTTSSGSRSHAEGQNTLALGVGSHAEGLFTTGSANYSHAQGQNTVASGTYSFAGGIYTIASGSGQTVLGKYNQRGNDFSLFVIGNGTGDDNSLRSDILRIENSSVQITGSLIISSSIAGSTTPLTNTDVILQSVLLYLANNT